MIQGDGAVATRSFASLNSEPLFLTARGVYALTPSDVTGERYAQERSWYIGAALTREQALEKACATVWGRFYVLAVNGTLYLLDGAQKSYESKNPYSTYQYETRTLVQRRAPYAKATTAGFPMHGGPAI